MRLHFKTAAVAALAAWTLSVSAQPRDEALFTAATAEQPAVVKTLEKLVNIETGTGTADGMAAMSDLLEAELKALGLSVSRSKAVGAVVGDNIVGRLEGKGGKKRGGGGKYGARQGFVHAHIQQVEYLHFLETANILADTVKNHHRIIDGITNDSEYGGNGRQTELKLCDSEETKYHDAVME